MLMEVTKAGEHKKLGAAAEHETGLKEEGKKTAATPAPGILTAWEPWCDEVPPMPLPADGYPSLSVSIYHINGDAWKECAMQASWTCAPLYRSAPKQRRAKFLFGAQELTPRTTFQSLLESESQTNLCLTVVFEKIIQHSWGKNAIVGLARVHPDVDKDVWWCAECCAVHFTKGALFECREPTRAWGRLQCCDRYPEWIHPEYIEWKDGRWLDPEGLPIQDFVLTLYEEVDRPAGG